MKIVHQKILTERCVSRRREANPIRSGSIRSGFNPEEPELSEEEIEKFSSFDGDLDGNELKVRPLQALRNAVAVDEEECVGFRACATNHEDLQLDGECLTMTTNFLCEGCDPVRSG